MLGQVLNVIVKPREIKTIPAKCMPTIPSIANTLKIWLEFERITPPLPAINVDWSNNVAETSYRLPLEKKIFTHQILWNIKIWNCETSSLHKLKIGKRQQQINGRHQAKSMGWGRPCQSVFWYDIDSGGPFRVMPPKLGASSGGWGEKYTSKKH